MLDIFLLLLAIDLLLRCWKQDVAEVASSFVHMSIVVFDGLLFLSALGLYISFAFSLFDHQKLRYRALFMLGGVSLFHLSSGLLLVTAGVFLKTAYTKPRKNSC